MAVGDQRTGVDSWALTLLGRYQTASAWQVLRKMLDDPSKTVRQTALEALSSHSEQGLDMETLFRLLHDAAVSIQNQAVDIIIQRDHPETLKHVIDVLRDESEYVRRAGVEVLNGICDTRSIRTLLHAIKDDDWWVRARAADALAAIGGGRVIKAVVELLSDEDEDIRRSAIEILNSIKDERSFIYLMNAVRDTDWWVRERAVDALGNLGNKAAVPALLPLLKSDAATCVAALRALSKLGDVEVLASVLQALDRKEPTVRSEAMLALVELTDANHFSKVMERLLDVAKHASEDEIREVAEDSATRLQERFERPDQSIGSLQSMAEGLRKARIEVKASSVKEAPLPEVPVLQSRPLVIDQLRAGEVLGDRYRYIRRVGRGSFGTVLLAEDMERGEDVILKSLHSHMANEGNMIKRFQREHELAKSVEHRNIIRIYDFFIIGGLYTISMEYFASTPLSADIKAKVPLGVDRSIAIIHDVASGMMAAHAQGIVHRDLKPANILIDEHNVVKVVDFGVSAAVDGGDTRLTRTGLLVGTPRYMAPEQILGKPVDERTDIYSLGVIFYEMLTGSPPFSGNDNVSVMYQHVTGKAPAPHERNPEISRILSTMVMRMMAKEPEKRFQKMKDVRRTLDAFMSKYHRR